MTRLAAVAGAITISFSAILYGVADVSPATGAFFRCAYALPLLFVIWWINRDRDSRPARKRWLAFGAGIFLGLDMVVWHLSIDHIGAGLSTLIANAQVVIVAVAAWLLLGEKPSRRVALAIPVVLVGVAMVSGLGSENAFGDNPALGAVLALAAAVLYAGFLMGLRSSNDARAPAAGPLLEATAGAALASLLAAPLTGGIDLTPDWQAHRWLLLLAITNQVLGWLLITYALPRLPAAETATVITLQPVLTMVWATILFQERPSALQLAGGFVVLAGVTMVALSRTRSVEPVPAGATG